MNNYELFFIDVMKIMPSTVDLYFYAPGLEDHIILKMIKNTNEETTKWIHLDEKGKNLFLSRLSEEIIIEFFQWLQIKVNGNTLFEGFDGIESGIFSRNINIPKWFVEKYKNEGVYSLSNEW